MWVTGCQSRSLGVGLIEVLVALLVMAIGVLGMAGVHTQALHHNQSAFVHGRATLLAADMLDRIRTNALLARSGADYQVTASEQQFSECLGSSYPNVCETGTCTPQQLAAYDIRQWKFILRCELPGTEGAISFSDADGQRIYTIRLDFPDSAPGYPASDVLLRGAL